MSHNDRYRAIGITRSCVVALAMTLCLFALPCRADMETYGVTDEANNFIPKIRVTVSDPEILIQKIDPADKFQSISLTLNSKYRKLINNVGLLKVQWIAVGNHAGRPLPFSGPRYNPERRQYQDSMSKSQSLKVIDETKKHLFKGKSLADILSIKIDDKPVISAESHEEQYRTVRMDRGRDVSIKVDKTQIIFNEENHKHGEILNVDNRSGYDQVIGVTLPEEGLLYSNIIRKPEQSKIEKDKWSRFTLTKDSGIFIVLIPETDPLKLSNLQGKEIEINVWSGNQVKETIRVPIQVSPELRQPSAMANDRMSEVSSANTPPPPDSGYQGSGTSGPSEYPESSIEKKPARPSSEKAASPAPRQSGGYGSIWLWVAVGVNLVLLLGFAAYGIFYVLPLIQVLEDRLAKSEMFIHGSREAIREELDEIKRDILQQCRMDSNTE